MFPRSAATGMFMQASAWRRPRQSWDRKDGLLLKTNQTVKQTKVKHTTQNGEEQMPEGRGWQGWTAQQTRLALWSQVKFYKAVRQKQWL